MAGNDAPIRVNPTGRYTNFDDASDGVDWSRAVPPPSNGGIRQKQPPPLTEAEIANAHNPTMIFNWPLPENHPALQKKAPPTRPPVPKRTVTNKPNAPAAKRVVKSATTVVRSQSGETPAPVQPPARSSEHSSVGRSSHAREEMRSVRRNETLRELVAFQEELEHDELQQLAEILRERQESRTIRSTTGETTQINPPLDRRVPVPVPTQPREEETGPRISTPPPPAPTAGVPRLPEVHTPPPPASRSVLDQPPPEPSTPSPVASTASNAPVGRRPAGTRSGGQDDGGVAGAFSGPHGLPGALPQLQRLLAARRRGEIQRAGDHLVVYENTPGPARQRPPTGQTVGSPPPAGARASANPNLGGGATGAGPAAAGGGAGWEISDFSYESLLDLGSMAVPTGLEKAQLAQYKPVKYSGPAEAKFKETTVPPIKTKPSDSKVGAVRKTSAPVISKTPASTSSKRPTSKPPTSSAEEATEDCSICLDSLVAGDESLRIGCGHVFHHPCLLAWLARTNRCPTCRFEIPRKKKLGA